MSDPIKTAVDLMVECCESSGLSIEFVQAEVTEPGVASFLADEAVTGTTIAIRCVFSDVSEEIVSEYAILIGIRKAGVASFLYSSSSTVEGTLYEAASEAATKVCNWLYDYRFPPTEASVEP